MRTQKGTKIGMLLQNLFYHKQCKKGKGRSSRQIFTDLFEPDRFVNKCTFLFC